MFSFSLRDRRPYYKGTVYRKHDQGLDKYTWCIAVFGYSMFKVS